MKAILTLLCSLAAAAIASAQTVPSLMNYQGRLTDEFGAPLTNGAYRLTFRLYTNAVLVANEPLIWGREYEATLIGGVFNVVLGADGGSAVGEPAAVNDLAFAFSGPNRFLELRVVRDAKSNTVNRTILPRQQLLSAPYAFMASALIKEFQEALCPPGTIVAFGGGTVPDGWLICNGTPYYATNYPKLFGAIQTAWGAGYTNGVKTADFNVPDLRGVFLRGVNGSRTGTNFSDPDVLLRTNVVFTGGNIGNAVGSYQRDALKIHHHTIRRVALGSGTSSAAIFADDEGTTAFNANYPVGINDAGESTEDRPKNAYVHYIIKY